MSGTKLPAIIKDLKGVDKYGGNSKILDSFIDSVETHIAAYGLPVQHAGWVLGKEGEYSFEEAISTTEDDGTSQINPNASHNYKYGAIFCKQVGVRLEGFARDWWIRLPADKKPNCWEKAPAPHNRYIPVGTLEISMKEMLQDQFGNRMAAEDAVLALEKFEWTPSIMSIGELRTRLSILFNEAGLKVFLAQRPYILAIIRRTSETMARRIKSPSNASVLWDRLSEEFLVIEYKKLLGNDRKYRVNPKRNAWDNRENQAFGRSVKLSHIKCYSCDQRGHIARDCRVRMDQYIPYQRMRNGAGELSMNGRPRFGNKVVENLKEDIRIVHGDAKRSWNSCGPPWLDAQQSCLQYPKNHFTWTGGLVSKCYRQTETFDTMEADWDRTRRKNCEEKHFGGDKPIELSKDELGIGEYRSKAEPIEPNTESCVLDVEKTSDHMNRDLQVITQSSTQDAGLTADDQLVGESERQVVNIVPELLGWSMKNIIVWIMMYLTTASCVAFDLCQRTKRRRHLHSCSNKQRVLSHSTVDVFLGPLRQVLAFSFICVVAEIWNVLKIGLKFGARDAMIAYHIRIRGFISGSVIGAHRTAGSLTIRGWVRKLTEIVKVEFTHLGLRLRQSIGQRKLMLKRRTYYCKVLLARMIDDAQRRNYITGLAGLIFMSILSGFDEHFLSTTPGIWLIQQGIFKFLFSVKHCLDEVVVRYVVIENTYIFGTKSRINKDYFSRASFYVGIG
jgi:hypothetical protein